MSEKVYIEGYEDCITMWGLSRVRQAVDSVLPECEDDSNPDPQFDWVISQNNQVLIPFYFSIAGDRCSCGFFFVKQLPFNAFKVISEKLKEFKDKPRKTKGLLRVVMDMNNDSYSEDELRGFEEVLTSF